MRMKIKKKIVMLLPNLQTGGAEKVSLLILNNLSCFQGLRKKGDQGPPK